MSTAMDSAVKAIRAMHEETVQLRDALRLVLPMAKGYAAIHPVGANAQNVEMAEEVLEEIDRAVGIV